MNVPLSVNVYDAPDGNVASVRPPACSAGSTLAANVEHSAAPPLDEVHAALVAVKPAIAGSVRIDPEASLGPLLVTPIVNESELLGGRLPALEFFVIVYENRLMTSVSVLLQVGLTKLRVIPPPLTQLPPLLLVPCGGVTLAVFTSGPTKPVAMVAVTVYEMDEFAGRLTTWEKLAALLATFVHPVAPPVIVPHVHAHDVTCDGLVSVTVAPVAGDGPLLVTVTV